MIVLLIIALIVATIILNAQNNAYKESGKKEDKVTFGKVVLWIVVSVVLVFLAFSRLMGDWGHDTSEIFFGR